ncbi:hypothetical protein WJX75_002414 [Coccomyxa subellipsoidea]|uniref:Smr domain-containing protein n=1 Tax=Coccomyxa subellipsoidea TaxID=248742 RepID=A0ABR2YPC4_9CHLO
MQDDSGPPTPESEDRASSLVACAAAGKMDAAAPVLNADDQRFATDMSTYGLARIGLPSPPYGRIPLTAAQEPQGVEVLYTGLFIGHAEQKKLFARVHACHENVTADHVTLSHKPSQIATTLPLGKSLNISVSAVLSDDRLQVLSVQLPLEIAAHFGGKVPHITVSYAAGARAKEAGDLLAEVCSGADRPVSMDVWQEPLELCARVGAKLSSGELVYSHEQLSDATAADLMSVWNTAGGLEREMHSSAAHSTCSVTQPQQTDDSCYECDSFWDTEAMSQRDVSAAGYRKSVTIRTAQIDSKDHGLEDWTPGVRSSGGGPAAVCAAQAAVARTMAERQLARSLADAERRSSLVHRSARDVFSQAAANAHQQGQRELARELVNKCREHDKLAVEARFRANEAAFDGSNRNLLNRWKVDLHGLHVDEALKVLETHLIALGGLGHPGGILLQVIVGLGRHSEGGVARILPAVVRYLTEAGYNFKEEPNNAGVICVLLPGKRNALSGQLNMTCNAIY